MTNMVIQQENALSVLLHPTERKILLGLREELPIWYLPGGKRDAGESFDETMRREIKEETNLDASILHQIGTMHYQNSRGIEKNMVFYLCQAHNDNACVTDEEIAWAWFSPDALPANFYSPFRSIIHDAQNSKTGQIYQRDISSEEFGLSIHADHIEGLHAWLTHPRVIALAQEHKLSFPVEKIAGIEKHQQAATLIQYQRNMMTHASPAPKPAPSQIIIPT